MDRLIIHPSEMSQWQALVSEASQHCQIQLTEELESYLVFTLMRFTQMPDLANAVVAKELLETLQQGNLHRSEQLRKVGDQCLLYSGLFPQRARKRRVRVSYYVKMGQTAYQYLSDSPQAELATLFQAVTQHFVPMMDVLQSMRDIDTEHPGTLDLLQAAELWQDTGSQHALNTLRHHAPNMSIIASDEAAANRRH